MLLFHKICYLWYYDRQTVHNNVHIVPYYVFLMLPITNIISCPRSDVTKNVMMLFIYNCIILLVLKNIALHFLHYLNVIDLCSKLYFPVLLFFFLLFVVDVIVYIFVLSLNINLKHLNLYSLRGLLMFNIIMLLYPCILHCRCINIKVN